MTDHDAGRLQAAIARWLTDNGFADPAIGAVEVMHMVRGHGWRPIPALQPIKPSGDSGGPTPEYLAVKAALTRKDSDGA